MTMSIVWAGMLFLFLSVALAAQTSRPFGRSFTPSPNGANAVGGAAPFAPVRPTQVFPELRSVKRTIALRPARKTFTLSSRGLSDPRIRSIDTERRHVMANLRAARRVRDVRAMSRSLSRLEGLRQDRLARMRSVGEPGFRAKKTPAELGTENPALDSQPVLPIPTFPRTR